MAKKAKKKAPSKAKMKPVKKRTAAKAKKKAPAKKNTRRRVNPDRLSVADRNALKHARQMSKRFHGTDGQVVELSASERKALPRFVAVAGDLEDFTYKPKGGKRAAYRWKHTSGDRGALGKKSKRKPLLVVDPNTRRPQVVANRSPMRFTDRGFVG